MADHERYIEKHEAKQISLRVRQIVRELYGFEAAAASTRCSHQHIQRMADPNKDNMITADIIVDLERAADKPTVTRYLAELSGYGLFKLPDPENMQKDWQTYAKLMTKVSEVLNDVAESLADDNQVSKDEIIEKNLIHDIGSLIIHLASIKADFEERVKS